MDNHEIALEIYNTLDKNGAELGNSTVALIERVLNACDAGFQLRPQWIDVNDRLPENREKVMICWVYENKEVVGTGSCVLSGSTVIYWQSGHATQMKVTHWMPLPKGIK